MKPIPHEEVTVWFNMNNIYHEKIELFSDIFKSLDFLIQSTYLGGDSSETTIKLNSEDKIAHFNWCWNKIIKDFSMENTIINPDGEHKDYLLDFYIETFYKPTNLPKEENIANFIESIFNVGDSFTKSDLDILTQIYRIMDKNVYY
jgi:hypothetical protein